MLRGFDVKSFNLEQKFPMKYLAKCVLNEHWDILHPMLAVPIQSLPRSILHLFALLGEYSPSGWVLLVEERGAAVVVQPSRRQQLAR